ncbi:MAG TPA: amino acid adenylation domain-containing protein, partial [Longimicrobium sp.]|nr:amino acid adenylation domain-containing protein [Longimicrobium sp.]
FEKLVEELNPERSLSHTPLFQVAFVLQNLGGAGPAAAGPQRLGAALVEPVARARHSARFDLLFTVVQQDGRTAGSVEYATDLWDAATMQRMLGHFAVLLDAALARPETRIGDLPLLRAEEADELRRLAAGPAAARDRSATLPSLFAAQVARTPDAVAVTFADASLTYAQLDARSTALARSLRARGIGAETPVAVFMERSLEMVIALYGILKAGAFYVPIDPEYPADRIAYMLEDSGARLVLTQQRLIDDLPEDVESVALDGSASKDKKDNTEDRDTSPVSQFPPSPAPSGGGGRGEGAGRRMHGDSLYAPDAPIDWEIDPDSLAYVIYTSGSTGRPKGAANAHRGVVNRILWMQETFGLTADDVVLQKTPFSFDVSVWEFFWPLMAGARLAVAAPGAHREPARLTDEIMRAGVTVAHFVPSMLQHWLDDGSPAACTTLRRVMSSGEALPAALRDRFFARLPGAELHNLYGPTEAAVDVTWHPCAPDDVSSAVPLGRPVANTAIHVLDPAGRPTPLGVPGELHIGGVQVGRGYWRRPALTADRFIPDPFSASPGARLYRTGDRARWTAAGVVEYLGRLDFQVKIRGLRIELGEIEAALAADPAVREAVLTAPRGPGGDPRLVAYLIPADGREISADEVADALRRTLPQHMVPAAWVVLDALPLTASGKVDRRALPEPDVTAAEHVEPRTPTEVALAAIWGELLGMERVGAEDGFFALGGHSLLGTRLLSRVRDAFGVELPLRAVFESPRLAALAAEIDRLAGTGADAAAPPIVPVDRTGDLPLSFAQERLWFVDRLEPGSPVYTMGSVYRLRGALDADALARALAEIVRRHESLRTVFPEVDGVPVQRVLPPAPGHAEPGPHADPPQAAGPSLPCSSGEGQARNEPGRGLAAPASPVDFLASVDVVSDAQTLEPSTAFHLPTHDLTALSEDERRASVDRIVRQPFTDPFDLARGPLLRAVLVKTADDEHLFAFNLHHVVGDGWSLGILFREMATLYAAFAAGRPSPLPDLPVQYGDYAAWQRAWLTGDVLDRQLAYWRGALAGAPPLLELPTDRPRPAQQAYRGAAEAMLLPADELAALQSLGQGEGATLFMTLLAAFSLVLARLSGQDDVVVGTPIAGRTRAETERLIGLFLNSLALRTDLSGEPTFRELLRRVRKTTLDAYARQDVPFERLLDELQPRRSLSHTPIFQVMLNLENYAGGSVDFAGVEVEAHGRAGEQTSKFDLTLYAMETPDGLALRLVYARDLFDAGRMREMLTQLRAILSQAVADPDTAATRLSLLSAAARGVLPNPSEPLSTAWRGSVPALFARRAAETPDALAVEDPRERWTYAELDTATAHIASCLVEAGVQPGDVVAIWGHRGAALVRALLGTLRSGAAFLVLDPAYPPSRLVDYLRIATPAAFLRITAAPEVPPEVAAALARTIRCEIPLAPRACHPEGDHAEASASQTPAARRIYTPVHDTVADAPASPPSTPDHPSAAECADAPQAPGPSLPCSSGEGQARNEPGRGPAAPASTVVSDATQNLGDASSADDQARRAQEAAELIGPDTLAYLSFTSGTTGTPKAVMGRHGSLTHFTPWLAETFGLTADDRFSMLSGLAHDPLHRDVFTPLQLGAAIIAPEPDEVGAPGYLAGWLRESAVTVAHLTPAMGQLIADVPGGVEQAAPIDTLRRAFFVGDVLTRGDVERLVRLAPGLTVINYYGSTETQRAVAYHVARTDADGREREVIPLGRGIPGVQLLVRNAAGDPAGIGEVGEIWLRSPHVALGYLNDPDLTAQRFIPNPWRADAGDVLYRTGDLGRYRPDGEVEPMGRADQQVKVRGFRVELGEIEAQLARHPSVREAVVIARGDAPDRRLVAYVVPQRTEPPSPPGHETAEEYTTTPQAPGPSLSRAVTGEGQARNEPGRGPTGPATPDTTHRAEDDLTAAAAAGTIHPEALRAHLRAALPEYMIPAAFVTLERLPLTQNAKVDRRALPEPDSAAEQARTAPRTETEAALAEIWREVLGHEVGVEDDFFASGGHSLRATQVLSRIRQRFGIALPVKTVFAAPTIATLAVEVDARHAEPPDAVDDDSALDADTGHWAPGTGHFPAGVYPLSFAQRRLWLLDRLDPGSAAYNLPAAYRIRGALDVPALERALGEIVRRHETLRTRIETRGDDEPVQVVAPAGEFHLPLIERPGISDDELRRIASEEAARPFSLSAGARRGGGDADAVEVPGGGLRVPVAASSLANSHADADAAGPLFRAMLVRIADDDHALLWTLHHAVSDGWSSGVLLRELHALYDAYAAGRPSPLPPLPVQYGVHAARQRRRLSGAALEAEVRWWKEALAGAPALLELPTDRPRPAVQSHRGATLGFGVPDELMARVDALARREGATPFMVLLAAFQAVLSRWSGQEDVVVGTPIANRTSADVEPLIGFFANTLALRGDLRGEPTFRALLARVREAALGAFDHQEVPFEKLVEELQPERSLSHSPVFQVMFALQNVPREGPRLAGLDLAPIGREGEAAKFDLSLTLFQSGGQTYGAAEYATDLFDAATVERFVTHFATLLAAATDDADALVADLPLMPPEERAELEARARPAASFPVDAPLHVHFARQVALTPHAVAVTFENASLTYAELDTRANHLAHHLASLGAAPGDRVGLCVERSLETVVGIVAILKAGAAYLPLDPAYPEERISHMLEDSGTRIVITTSGLESRGTGEDVRLVVLDRRDAAEIDARPPTAPAVDVRADAAAYVIYTSGSTGRPKGVEVTHANAARLFAATEAWFGFDAGDVWTLFHSYAFDFSVWEIWGALLYGGRLVVVPFDVSRNPDAFLALVEREGVTVLNQTPSAFRQLMHADEVAAAGGAARPLSLRAVIFGGEALDPASLRGWVERRGDDRPVLVNMYGITETTVHVTYRVIRRADVLAGSASPIGVPIPDLSVQVLDARGRLVPAGVVGEMYVGGAGVARGYLGRPGLTAQRFVPDPFGGPGARRYRSGDLARWIPGGGLEFFGRADQQVKVRGYRIELGEIESVLLEHPAVREAVVLARGSGDEQRLVAWIVAAGGDVSAAGLRAHLAARLPDHMVPAAFVPVDVLPLTPSGKVDHRALPEPDGRGSAEGYVAPWSPTEIELADVWREVLGVERVGAADDFFALGGHSLLAVKLATRIRQRFGRELPLAELFRSPTLRALASRIESGAEDGPASPLVAIHAGGTRPPLFCVHPAGGTVFRYTDLARRLGPDQPFHGLQARGVNDDAEPLATVDEMADLYLAAIRAAFPRGPYVLAGWSAGGTIAYEIARRLRDAGETVPLVALLDTHGPKADWESRSPDEVDLYLRYTHDLAGVAPERLAELEAELRALPADERLRGLADWIARGDLHVAETTVAQIARSVRVFATTMRAV